MTYVQPGTEMQKKVISVLAITLNGFSLALQQIIEYEDFRNDTELEYEEYEIFEDDFDFAERERAETLNVEVNCMFSWMIMLWLLQSSVYWLFPSMFWYSLQAALRAEKGQKGEQAVIEPVSCY